MDTSVWSLVLRRRPGHPHPMAEILTELIAEERALMIGPIRQELLSGIADPVVFERVAFKLRGFDDLPLPQSDYVKAAQFSNACRAKGIQGSGTDFLICAAAVRNELSIFTTDKDFSHYAKHLPIHLFDPASI